MSTEQILNERSSSKCELCSSNANLSVFQVPPTTTPGAESCILVCQTCLPQINGSSDIDLNHWHCLNESMWSEFNPVKVVAWRILQKIRSEGWARDLQEQLYLEEEVQQWAESGTLDSDNSDSTLAKTKDSNGNILLNGDAVTLIKDLQVKGAGFTAKRGTLVKNITLTDNPSQIEGKVNGTQIVLLTQFLKKVTD